MVSVRVDHYVTPPRKALKEITPLISPKTLSKLELNDAALTLTRLSEAFMLESNEGKKVSKKKGPRTWRSPKNTSSTRNPSTSHHDMEQITPANTKICDERTPQRVCPEKTQVSSLGRKEELPVAENVVGQLYHKHKKMKTESNSLVSPPTSGKTKRAASQKCVAMLKEALLYEMEEKTAVDRKKKEKRDALIETASDGKIEKNVVLSSEDATTEDEQSPPMVGKVKRAASKKCAELLREALSEERKPEKKETVMKVIIHNPPPQKTWKKTTKADGPRKRSRNYSQHSRVGRAVQAIYAYIVRHQPTYLEKGSKGVPERVIRLEYGNNPDTSKALRYLVTENRITRRGAGGRRDPFSYTINEISGDASEKETDLLKSLRKTSQFCSNFPDHQTAVAASLAEPSATKPSIPEEEKISCEDLKQKRQLRLSFGEAPSKRLSPGQGTGAIGNLPLSPLPPLNAPQFLKSTMITESKDLAKQALPSDKIGAPVIPKMPLFSPAAHAAYMMQVHTAQILWNQSIMAMMQQKERARSKDASNE